MFKYFNSLAAIAVMAATVTFTSCNDNDNDTPDVPVKPSTGNVFENGMPAAVGDAQILTNAEGQVTKIVDGSETYTFEYGSFSRSTEYQVRLTIADSDHPQEGSTIYMQLNNNGFVTSALQVYNDGDEDDTWRFEYDRDGHLTRLTRSESGDNYKINYSNCNISEVVKDDEDGDHREYTFVYTGNGITTAIANKGCVMEFDEFFQVDMDEMGIVYYAGLLGKATRELPLGYTVTGKEGGDNYTSSQIYHWTFDSNGYPIEFWEGDNRYDLLTFTWK